MASVDLHCHTGASFDCLANPAAVVAKAAQRGLTHIAITDHDTLDGAFRARDAAPVGLTVIIGCEVLTTRGDLIVLFLERPIPTGLTPHEAIQAAREQGALVGMPHPFDSARRSMLAGPRQGSGPAAELDALAADVDWLEALNARVTHHRRNEEAQTLARKLGRPGIAVSDAHSLLEVGAAFTRMDGDPSTPAGLLAALRGRLDLVAADDAKVPDMGRPRRWYRPRKGI